MTVPAGEAGELQPSALRVLVVDDDEVDRMMVRRGLQRVGQHAVVVEASTAIAALEEIGGGTFDCVFLDYNIPGGDGLTLLKGIRGASLDVPVVMLTGQGDEEVAVELMKAGAVDYLPKGTITPERLTQSLRYAVELSRAAHAARRAEAELRESERRARYLADVSAALGGSLDLRSTLERTVESAVPMLADYCLGYLVTQDGDAVGVVGRHSDPAKDANASAIARYHRPDRNNTSSPLACALRTATTQHVVVTPELVASAISEPRVLEAIHSLQPRDLLVVPLVARGRVLGALTLVRETGRSGFAISDITLAEEMGRRAAVALDNAWLYEDARVARMRTERLQSVTARLVETLSPTEVAEIFVTEVREALSADSAWVALKDESGTAIVTIAHSGFRESDLEPFRRIPMNASLPVNDIFADGEPRWFQSKDDLVDQYPVLAGALDRFEQEALATLPLDAGDGTFGVITLGFREVREFDREERDLAIAFARQCAQALERARLFDAAQRARAEAEEANRAKSEFLARMSHDLRTPLNAISGYAQLIELEVHGPVTQAQLAALSRIRRAQEHLLTLINDILSFAKLEAGQVQFRIGEVPLNLVLTDTVSIIEPLANARNIRFSVRYPPRDLAVVTDPERLQQVLANLGSNAVKFTPEGGEIHLECETPSATTVAITVRDTGVGIDVERLQSIFDPFVQVGRHPGDERSGVGLGLAISRELVRAMGGQIAVQSEPGKGSAFTVMVPRAPQGDGGQQAQASA